MIGVRKMSKYKCPVCGEITMDSEGDFDICDNCGWEDDNLQRDNPNYHGGANEMSLNEAIEAYKNGEQIR